MAHPRTLKFVASALLMTLILLALPALVAARAETAGSHDSNVQFSGIQTTVMAPAFLK